MFPGFRSKNPPDAAAALLITGFLGMLWLPLADWSFHLDRAPIPNENRALATFPALSSEVTDWRGFVSGLDAYYRDHFGFRNRLVRWSNRWKHQWFRESIHPGVGIGQQGWLFLMGDGILDDYVGRKRFSEQHLEHWRQLLEKRRDWLAQRGGKYIFVIVPDKHSIYPEYLPSWMVGSPEPNNLDRFFAYMKAHSTVPVVDLRPSLLEAKKAAPTYFQNDTHWNQYGAFVAYQTVLGTLAAQLPGLKPLTLEAFDWKFAQQPGGDLALVLGQASQLIETNVILLVPLKPGPVVKTVPERLPKKWKPYTEPIASQCPEQTGKAIVFRDSFAGDWRPFLGGHFHEVLYIWQHEWDAAFIEREKPTVVIDEIVERFFNNTDPVKVLREDSLR